MTTTSDERLRIQADVGAFEASEVARCDEPVRRYFDATIRAGAHAACGR